MRLSTLDIRRARERADTLEVEENDGVELNGLLVGLMPIHRRFEFMLHGADEIISGAIAPDASRQFQNNVQGVFDNPLGRHWRARFRIREVRARNQNPRRYYVLLGLIEEIERPG